MRDQTRSFSIEAADSRASRAGASALLQKMYGSRGYRTTFASDLGREHLTLVANDGETGRTLGTLTVSLDSPKGLFTERLYSAETSSLRESGSRLCEMIRFAIDGGVRSRRVLAALFHVGFVYAHRVQKCSDLLIEVTPQHAAFYRNNLHFEELGAPRLNPRVNTVGVMMRLDLAHAGAQIEACRAGAKEAPTLSLYSLAFPSAYASTIQNRINCWQSLPDIYRECSDAASFAQ